MASWLIGWDELKLPRLGSESAFTAPDCQAMLHNVAAAVPALNPLLDKGSWASMTASRRQGET